MYALEEIVTLNATVNGGSSALTIQWQSSPNGSSGWVNIGGANSSTYNPPTGTAGTTYFRVIITDNLSDCSDPISETAQEVVVSPDLTVTTQPTNVMSGVGGTSTMTVATSGGSGNDKLSVAAKPSWNRKTGPMRQGSRATNDNLYTG